MAETATVLAALDDIEGYRHDDPDKSLYLRQQADVVLPDGSARPRLGLFLQRAARPRAAHRVRRLSRTREGPLMRLEAWSSEPESCEFRPALRRVFGDLAVDDRRAAACLSLQRLDEMLDGRLDVVGVLDELDAGPIDHDPFLQLADVAVGDPPLDDDRALAERNPEFVQRVELQRERAFRSARPRG